MFTVALVVLILISVGALMLGSITLLNNPRSWTNRVFALLCALSAAYPLLNFLSDHDQTRALFWSQATISISALMLLALVLFTNNFPGPVWRRSFEPVLAIIALAMAFICFLPGFVTGVILSPGHTDVETGWLYPLYLIYVLAYYSLTLILARANYMRSVKLDRERARYVLLGFGLTTIPLVLTNLVLPLLVGTNKYSGYGSYFIVIFIAFTSYALIRHRLFNIRSVVTKSLTYILLLITVAALYSIAIFGITQYFFNDTTSKLVENATNTVLALVVAFTFQPLRRFFEKATDRFFYRDRYDSQVVLDNFSQILVSELDLDKILHRSLAALTNDIHIQYAQLAVFNDGRIYRIEHHGKLPERLMIGPELMKLDKKLIVSDELASGNHMRILMDEHGIRVSLMLRTREEFVGFLMLGDKLSGEIYSKQDLELLQIIAKQLAVAILNAKAYIEIQEFNLTLQERVDHATQRLRVANRHLKELDKAKDEFISMASHQLRTPLTTIKGYLSMLLEGDAGKMTGTQKEFVDFAFGSSERMVNLISDLLNVSRLSAGRFLIQTKPTDIVAMIKDEVRQLKSHAKAKNLDLVFTPPEKPLPMAEIDEGKTRQVIMNFIDNAIYYTKEGSVTVVLEQTGDKVRLEVHDTGIGVPEKAKRKLFSKFYRADNAQTVRPDGTGLGLYLARRVIEDQGGTIIFTSTEGKGSTFGFELPLKSHVVIQDKAKA